MCWGKIHYFYATSSYRLAFLLCSENSPFTFYPSKGVNLELCLSSHDATTKWTSQLGRRCLDAVLHPFSHPAFPDTFRSISISFVKQAGLRSHSLKAKMGSHINHTDHKIMRSSPWSDLELCFTHLFCSLFTWSTSCFSNSCSCLWKPMFGLAQDLAARTTDSASSQPKSVMVMM